MHSHVRSPQSVVYRDLKPDNIGFDVRGDVKIFDFGLSRQIPSGKSKDGLYKMTGDTGSPRYMAPEGKDEVSGIVHSRLASLY